MTSRISRLFFGLHPARACDFGDSCVAQVPTPLPVGELLAHVPVGRWLSDESLAAHLQNGNPDALTLLFERHSPLLFGMARRVLRNDAEAEDAVQQIFLDVFRSIHQFNSEKGRFRTWLLMFGYQRILNCRRALVARRFFNSELLEEPLLLTWTQHNNLADTVVLVEQVLRHLDHRQRRTIELIYYEGLTAQEVSQRTGETVRVVRHNLYRGLKKLRLALGEGWQ